MAAPASEPQLEPYRLSDQKEQPEPAAPAGIEGTYGFTQTQEGQPVMISIQVTQQDQELQAIEATLVILQMLPYETRVRALNYIRDRVMSDPGQVR